MASIISEIFNLFRSEKSTVNVRPDPFIDKTITLNSDGKFSDDFYLNLQKTIAWTGKIISSIEDYSKINYATVLRTINPIYKGEPFYKYENTEYNYPSTPEVGFNYNTILTNVMSYRNETILPNRNLHLLGKILLFEIDLTTHDGAPCAESEFVDQSDIPPIDTWFYVTDKFLYCWIPAMFIHQMQLAIDVEIYGSYEWLEDIDPKLNRHVFNLIRPSVG